MGIYQQLHPDRLVVAHSKTVRTLGKDPKPEAVADRAERLLNGTSHGWDVDDYEHLNPHEPRLRELWQRTMAVGGLPEEWVRLDGSKKTELRDIIAAMRHLGS